MSPELLQTTYPRQFVPPEADLGTWEQVEPLFRSLLDRPVESPEALERWLLDWSELGAALSEERARRYVAMTQQTDDPQREAVYLQFVREVQPRAEPLWFEVRKRYLELRERFPLPQRRYFVLDRDTQNAVSLFREENVPLRVQEDELEQRYQRVTGAWTVRFRGQEYTVQQMARFLEEPDRATRQEAWEAVVRRRLLDREVLDGLYDALVALRHRIAQNAGFPDYRAYAFRAFGRWDYTPEDCLAFHAAVERHVVPLLRTLHEDRRARLGVDRLRPWDLEVDPQGRPPLRPFAGGSELAERAVRVFERVHPELGAQFRFLAERGLLDLDSRKGKAPGGYQATLDERRWPFIFMNAVGVAADVRTVVHEGGHAFHTLAVREEPLLSYRHAPTEFSEVASMGMEVLSLPHLDVFYPDPEDRERARREFFEGVVRLLPWIATIDLFQHHVYTRPEHTREERTAWWVEIHRRFQPVVDWSGYEEAEACLWHRQLHLFLYPFYYIEYGIAQLGALQLWLQSLEDYEDAVARYRAALRLGGSRPLRELFEAARLRFRLGSDVVPPVAHALREALQRS
ncbi:Oligoendopeptidase F, plasmid [bacterium HR32]|nr:Oligoendopeptidase F, plasmid [bacterium HR32]